MIKIQIIAVGKLKENYLRDACAEYLKRLGTLAKVSVTEVGETRCSDRPSQAEIDAVLQKEGEQILSKIPKGAYVIAMCIEGKQLASEEIASTLGNLTVQGESEIVFVIGGSFGLSDDVKARGNLRLSFGKITLPHQLMRVVLLEQIYRALSINSGSKYHK